MIATPGLILYIACIIINVIALITDLFLIKYEQTSITEESRRHSTIACGILSFQWIQLLALIIHLYM